MRGTLCCLLLALASCKKPADCDAVVGHVTDLFVKAQIEHMRASRPVTPEEETTVRAELAKKAHADVYEQCKKKWTKREEACILKADSVEAVSVCDVPPKDEKK